MINDRAKELEQQLTAAGERRLLITQLTLLGWEPVKNSASGARVLNRGRLQFYARGVTDTGWHFWACDLTMIWAWQPCEWARFSAKVLRQLLKEIGERDGIG